MPILPQQGISAPPKASLESEGVILGAASQHLSQGKRPPTRATPIPMKSKTCVVLRYFCSGRLLTQLALKDDSFLQNKEVPIIFLTE